MSDQREQLRNLVHFNRLEAVLTVHNDKIVSLLANITSIVKGVEEVATSTDAKVELFIKIGKFGGFASLLGLVLFLGYLLTLGLIAIYNYAQARKTEHAETKAKVIDQAAGRAARRLYKKSTSSGSRDKRSQSREDVTLM